MSEKKVLTMGTFDLLHFGHINLLKKARELGDLVVGVNTDDFIRKYKGEPPIMRTSERLKTLRMLGYRCVENNGPGQELITQYSPDIIAVGSDWLVKDYLKQIDVDQEFLRTRSITIAFIPYTVDISTTLIKERLWTSKP